MDKKRIQDLYDFYRKQLLEQCMPFWLENSIDSGFGGYLTCLDREGSVYNTDKSVWFQGRGVWIYSKLYNELEPNPVWLNAAATGFDFLLKHCFDKDGRLFFQVTQDGKPLRRRRYFYSEAFAIAACTEFYKATGDREALSRAMQTYDIVMDIYKNPQRMEPKVIPETRITRALAVPMILLVTTQILREAEYRPVYDKIAEELVHTILHVFLKPDERALFETVGPNGERLNSPQGRCINPGHAIETAWFLIQEGLYLKNNDIIHTALNIIKWSLDIGWDKEYGGLLSFVDIEGKPAEQLEWNMKMWWPHTEALYALLLAYDITRDPYFETWYDKVHEWTFSYFPDKEYKEWYGYLHRDGSVANTLKGSMWKGPFHIPRALLLCMKLLEKIR